MRNNLLFWLDWAIICHLRMGKEQKYICFGNAFTKLWTSLECVCCHEIPEVKAFHLTLFRIGLFGAIHECRWNLPHRTYNDETWHSYTLPKEDPKNMSHVTHPLSSADISIFLSDISKFYYIWEYRYRLHFGK